MCIDQPDRLLDRITLSGYVSTKFYRGVHVASVTKLQFFTSCFEI
jgi:hypothetical protein